MKTSFNKTDYLYLLLFVALFLAIFHSFFFQSQTFYERDSTLLETPVRLHVIQLLEEGNFALWTDSHGQGQPLLANMKTAVFYPSTWLYLFLPFFVAFKIHYLIHPIIGWIGMYLLGKSYGFSQKASFLASSLFFFSGMYLSSFEFYNHIAAIAWMMWALFLARLSRPIKSSTFLFNILVWALLILSGAPEFIIIAGILVLTQAFITGERFKSYILKLFAAFFLAALICAVQLIPSFEMLSQAERSPQSVLWPLELIQLNNLTFHGIFGDDRQPGHNLFWGGHLFNTWYPLYYSLYIGFGALLLSLVSLFRLKDRRIKLWLIVGVLFFLMSCGKYSPFFFIYQHIPVLSSIRFPVKFFIGSIFCLSLMAGYGLDWLRENDLPSAFKKVLATFSILSLLGYMVFKGKIISVLSQLFVMENPGLKQALYGSILYGLIILAFYAVYFIVLDKFNRGRASFIAVLIAICLIDPVYHNRYINPTVEESFFQPPAILNEIKTPVSLYRGEMLPFVLGVEETPKLRIMSFYRQTLFPYSGLPYGVRYVFNPGFMATYPHKQEELTKSIKSLKQGEQIKILKYLGCQYYIGNKPFFSMEKSKKIVAEGFTQYLEKIADEPARPTVVYDFVRAETEQERLDIFTSAEFDPQKTVIIGQGIKLPEKIGEEIHGAQRKDYSLDILEEKAGYGRYKINLPAAGLAIFPSNWAKGWKAWIDGKRVDVFEANLFSKGLAVPPGEHLVRLRYWPDSFILGCIIGLLSLFSVIVVWSYFYAKKKIHG
ncbi:MAG TPA: hypothetical protein PLL62_08065 [Candidatus Saccharicenans sp.]|nr:hypothetical protein [Candidatus Saccharicenans sp.]